MSYGDAVVAEASSVLGNLFIMAYYIKINFLAAASSVLRKRAAVALDSQGRPNTEVTPVCLCK